MKRIKFRKYAGVRVDGKVSAGTVKSSKHLDRVEWLTAQVESGGKFGTVISYDGTGMTAGLHQAIAVFPKEVVKDDDKNKRDQGPLWTLLYRIFALMEADEIKGMWNRFTELGWVITPEGVVRDEVTSKAISGRAIRKEFTGAANGVMPMSGSDRKRAEDWAKAFSELFSHDSTFAIQRAFGEEYVSKRATRLKMRFSKKGFDNKTIQDAVYGAKHVSLVDSENPGHDFPVELDLAMSVLWSHAVNAPGKALQVICRAIDACPINQADPGSKIVFAKRLLRFLANSNYGRWNDEIKSGRYQRTRKAAMKIWPANLFTGPGAIMPPEL